jgi:hypothetical protein
MIVPEHSDSIGRYQAQSVVLVKFQIKFIKSPEKLTWLLGVITHARPLTFGTYPSDSPQPGLGPVDPTSHSASHSGPGRPLADKMVRVPHGSSSWRDDAARVVWSSLMSTEVSLATSLYDTWIVLTGQPTMPAACRRPSRLWVQTPLLVS